jgi:hypothetical protein
MRSAVAGFLGGVVVTAVLWVWMGHDEVRAQGERPLRGEAAAVVPLAWTTDSSAFVAVVDTQARVLSVYEVHRTTGAIALRSVRNLKWDLQLEELNTANPSPREVRSIVDQQ